jgi:predicted nucleic acid-binding protein
MTALLDTSIIVASLDPDEPHHAACDRLVGRGGHVLHAHALAETFSILTGGRHGRRLAASQAAELLDASVLPFVSLVALTGRETVAALQACEARGVRGGAVYDWLHLAAARKAGAARLITLDAGDFRAIARPGDPTIETP